MRVEEQGVRGIVVNLSFGDERETAYNKFPLLLKEGWSG
jgi:hypothetical protein